MSAPNFWTMDNFDLYVIGNEDVCLMYIGDEDEDGNKITEYSYDDIDFAWDCFWNEDICINEAIDDLNDTLQWYKAELKSGYYEGVQIYIDSEWVNIGEWSDEDCRDEFDLSKKETMLMILEEQKRIAEWLEKEATQYGFRKLICDGVFSNGEAIYHYA